MRLRADWTTYLHSLRAREFDRIFGRLPAKAFTSVLELGAGDGFQARLLSRYAVRVVSTDYYRPPVADGEGVVYRACDAERLTEEFEAGEFDLIYSSNMLEHVPQPQVVLRGIAQILANDGITIHVMPNRLWKLSHLALHWPNLILSVAERAMTRTRIGKLGSEGRVLSPETRHSNNPKLDRHRRARLRRWMLDPHGVSRTNLTEFVAFGRGRWRDEFERAGFEVVAVLKGPLASGYGFGLDRLRALGETIGLASEFVYVARKAGSHSRHAADFLKAGRTPRAGNQ
jgi:SAM-dependent methyltransferase